MVRELRKLRARGGADRAKANYIFTLQKRGLIRKLVSANGYVAYDTEEYKTYRKNAKRGRPCITR